MGNHKQNAEFENFASTVEVIAVTIFSPQNR